MALGQIAIWALGTIGKVWPDLEPWWMNVRINSPYPGESVPFGWVKVNGAYRADLRKNLVLFHRSGNLYFPQSTPVLGNHRWNAEVHIGQNPREHHSIVIAIVSPDIQALINYFGKVHAETQKWVGIQFNTLPIGMKVLAEIEVHGKPGAPVA